MSCNEQHVHIHKIPGSCARWEATGLSIQDQKSIYPSTYDCSNPETISSGPVVRQRWKKHNKGRLALGIWKTMWKPKQTRSIHSRAVTGLEPFTTCACSSDPAHWHWGSLNPSCLTKTAEENMQHPSLWPFRWNELLLSHFPGGIERCSCPPVASTVACRPGV